MPQMAVFALFSKIVAVLIVFMRILLQFSLVIVKNSV